MMTTSKIIKDKNKFKYESKNEDNLKKGADPEKEDYLKNEDGINFCLKSQYG